MLSQRAFSRLVSLANASSLVRTGSSSLRTFTTGSTTGRGTLFSCYSRLSASKHSSPLAAVSSTYALGRSLTAPKAFQGQILRGFSQRTELFSRPVFISSTSPRSLRVQLQQHQRRAYSDYPQRRRRPFRFLFKVMLISSALVALPAIIVFGAPVASLFVIPLAVGSIVGGALLLTGGVLFLALPMAAVGGAIALYVFSMPAAVAIKDMNNILKRESGEHYKTALAALGPDWEVQSSSPDEWFRWEFPTRTGQLDRINIRMAVFDPNDQSGRKERMFRFLDRIESESSEEELVVIDGEEKQREKKVIRSGNFEISNNSESLKVQHLHIKREQDHVLITMEDRGERLMEQKWARKYLDLARIVDRAATEMEAQHPGLSLGQQVVLVHRNERSLWNRLSFYGDVAVRVPVDRQWVKDLSEL
ncbi:hypothetical protein EMPS_04797 [Entomortierella parvispora]|uniref:Uncharacterized protein n=1 Tax=Entomortierella parvispora TaxID=205924 RepID=A0A9P3H9G8_9FUNG|nr:hypothetical protein EMPS_04797 [Entomortierella parvispora]